MLLRSGLVVADVTAIDPHVLRKAAGLEGLSTEAMQLRHEAENERRSHRLAVVRAEYDALCGEISHEEIVSRVRGFIDQTTVHAMAEPHHMAASRGRAPSAADHSAVSPLRSSVREGAGESPVPRESNISPASTNDAALPSLVNNSCAPIGPKSLHYMDSNCVTAADRARERASSDARRVLRQKELRTQQQAAREHLVHQSESEAIERNKQMREQARLDQLRRHDDLRAKDKAFRERVSSIKDAERRQISDKASKIHQRDSAVTSRLAAIRAHRDEANISLKDERKQHRDAVRKKDDEQQQRRRKELVEASEEAQRKYDETISRKREETAKRNSQKSAVASALQEAVKEAQLLQKEKTEARRNAVEREADERHRAFQHRRELRLQAQRDHNEHRASRSRFSREVAEERHQGRLEAIKAHYQDRIATVEGIKKEKEREGKLQKEAIRQMRESKREEQQRVDKASAFALLGYVSDNAAKSLSVQHERSKREVLANHVRTEREAIMRALAREVTTIEAENAVRMKDECSALHQL